MKELNNNIQEPYCSFEVSKLFKEKGYAVPSLEYYMEDEIEYSCSPLTNWNKNNDTITRPTHALALEWIRVNFGISIWANCTGDKKYWYEILGDNGIWFSGSNKDTPQEATEAALLYTLQNLIP